MSDDHSTSTQAPRGGRARALGVVTALAGGAAYALAAPPVDLYPGVFVGLALLFASLELAKSGRAAFVHGLLWSLVTELVVLRTIPGTVQRFTPLGPVVAAVGYVLLSATQALTWGAGAYLAFAAKKRLRAPAEASFAAGVFAAVLLPTVFRFTPAGLLSPWPSLVQLGDVVGERGVSLLLALASALAAAALARRHAGRAIAAVAIVSAMALFGRWRMRSIEQAEGGLTRLTVGIVQPSIGAIERWSPDVWPGIMIVLRGLSARAEAQGAELTLWPESSYPWVLPHAAGRNILHGDRAIVDGDVHGPVLLGLLTRAVDPDHYNSATIVDRRGFMQLPADKLELLWFGEEVPFGEYFPSLRRLFQRGGGLLPGDGPRLLTTGAARIAVLSCYEDTIPGAGRKVAAVEPNLLVNLTNDAWFDDPEPEMHLRVSVMRAVELRRDLLRAVNLGIGGWIDAAGRVRARNDSRDPGLLLATPALHDASPTLFARVGDWPLALVLAAAAAGLAVAAKKRRDPGAPA